MRQAVPRHIPFTAKMRLGVADTGKALDCAGPWPTAASRAWWSMPAPRTTATARRPTGSGSGRIADVVAVPVVANGEVWTEDDWRRCRAVSGATDVMLGRGAVADPFWAAHPRRRRRARRPRRRVGRAAALIAEFWRRVLAKVEARHAPGRLKQWLNLLRRNFPQAETLYREIRPQADPRQIDTSWPATAYRCCGRPRRIAGCTPIPHPRKRPAGCP